MKPTPFIYKDSVCVCPQCHTVNYRITRDCFYGDMLVVEMFEARPGIHPPVNGEILGCSECRHPWWDFCVNPDKYVEQL